MSDITNWDQPTKANFQMNLSAGRWIFDIRRDMADLRIGPLPPETALAFHTLCKALKNLADVTDRQLEKID